MSSHVVLPDNRAMSTADVAREMNEDRDDRTHYPQEHGNAPLLPREVTDDMRDSWTRIQTGFVDEPRRAVKEADELVASAIRQIAENFARERQNLESQWDREGDVSTEDLRVALTRYRSFFQRLLSM